MLLKYYGALILSSDDHVIKITYPPLKHRNATSVDDLCFFGKQKRGTCCVRLARYRKWGRPMVRKALKPEQVIGKLREVEVLLSQGSTVGEASRKIGVTERTYYRWRKEWGGMRMNQAKRLQELDKENCRLKKLVLDS
jgi:putative transposase